MYSQFAHIRNSFWPHFWKRALVLLFTALIAYTAWTQQDYQQVPEPIAINLQVVHLGDTDVSSLVSEQSAWLSVREVFGFIGIPCRVDPVEAMITGFLTTKEDSFRLEVHSGLFRRAGKQWQLPPGAIRIREGDILLHLDWFGQLWGLDCRYDFRSLSVTLNSKEELPAVIEKKRAQIKSNYDRLLQKVTAEQTISPDPDFFSIHAADWALNTAYALRGQGQYRANLHLGGVLANGELSVALQLNERTVLDARQQYYLWRHANDHHPLVRQFSIGKIQPNAVSTLLAPVVGAQISNATLSKQKFFGSYLWTDYTEPGSWVELYVNYSPVDYKQADASGFYSFEIPLGYGSTQVKLVFYAPDGTQRKGETWISVPYSMLPAGRLEYSASAGFFEDGQMSQFGRVQANFGVWNGLTIGAGTEYLSSISNNPQMPFAMASMRLSRRLFLTAHYMPDVRSHFTANFQPGGRLLLEGVYTKYKPGQTAIYNNYLEERRLSAAMPFHIKAVNFFSRLSAYQIVLASTRYTTAEWVFTGSLPGASMNFSTFGIFTQGNTPYWYSNIAMAFRLPGKMLFLPQAQYEYNRHRFISAKIEMERRISGSTYFQAFWEENFKSRFQSVNIGLRVDLRQMQARLALRSSSNGTQLLSAINGAMLRDGKSGYSSLSRQPNVGRGTAVFTTFLDFNANGKREVGEPKIGGLKFSLQAGIREVVEKDTLIVVRGLEAYNSYMVTIDKNSFDPIAWQIGVGTINVVVRPNQFTAVDVPVAVVGEVTGTIFFRNENMLTPQGRITIHIYDTRGKKIAETLSEPSGYFTYLGLAPGKYFVAPNEMQLRQLGLSCTPRARTIEVHSEYWGDIVTSQDFELRKGPSLRQKSPGGTIKYER